MITSATRAKIMNKELIKNSEKFHCNTYSLLLFTHKHQFYSERSTLLFISCFPKPWKIIYLLALYSLRERKRSVLRLQQWRKGSLPSRGVLCCVDWCWLQKFRISLSVHRQAPSSFLTLEGGTDRLSRNFGDWLQIKANISI